MKCCITFGICCTWESRNCSFCSSAGLANRHSSNGIDGGGGEGWDPSAVDPSTSSGTSSPSLRQSCLAENASKAKMPGTCFSSTLWVSLELDVTQEPACSCTADGARIITSSSANRCIRPTQSDRSSCPLTSSRAREEYWASGSRLIYNSDRWGTADTRAAVLPGSLE